MRFTPVCVCDSKAYDVQRCSRASCHNIVCEVHGGVADGDLDEEGFAVNASRCAEHNEDDSEDSPKGSA